MDVHWAWFVPFTASHTQAYTDWEDFSPLEMFSSVYYKLSVVWFIGAKKMQ